MLKFWAAWVPRSVRPARVPAQPRHFGTGASLRGCGCCVVMGEQAATNLASIPLPPRDRQWVETFPCAICGGPAVIVATDGETAKPIRICADHLPAEARAVYDRLRARGWRAPAPRVRALFDAHPHGQRIGRRIKMETD